MDKKIVYIASANRSGSTLLNLLLGNHPDIFSVSELRTLNERYNNREKCLCGNVLSQCGFWKKIEKNAGVNLSSMQTKIEYDKLQFIVFLLLSVSSTHRSSLFVKTLIPKIARNYNIIKNIYRIYDAIYEETGKNIIVDSSKDPLMLKYLFLTQPEKIYCIFLQRDGRAVMNSSIKRQMMPEQSVKVWLKANKKIEYVARSIPKKQVFRLKYEALCAKPEYELQKICNYIGIDYSNEVMSIKKAGKHDIGGSSTITGDSSNELKILLDEKWKKELGNQDIELFNRYASKYSKLIGYF